MVIDRKIVPKFRKIIQDEKLRDTEEERQHVLRYLIIQNMVNLKGNTRYGGISVTSQYLREDKSRSGLTRLKNATREKETTVALFAEYEAALIKDFI